MSDSLPFTVGLTGGIGSGKSVVSEIFSNLKVPVIDTDQLSRNLVQVGSPVLNEISDYFSDEVLLSSGELDRKKLRKIIFSDPEKKQWLEQLLHPEIRKLLLKELSSCTAKYAVIVVPLLLESDSYKFINRILVVDSSEELQLKRSMSRDRSSSKDIKKIRESQAPRKQRLALADDVIINETSLEALKEKVLKLHEKYQQLSN